MRLEVLQVHGQSEKSWEDATRKAIATASRTLPSIRSVYIIKMNTSLNDGRASRYRVDGTVSFLLSNA